MRSTTLSTLTLAAALALGACGDERITAPPTEPAVGPEFAKGGLGAKGGKPSNRIVYTHTDSNQYIDIYTMNPDGSNVVRLLPFSGYSNRSPRWTADHNRIVFTSFRNDIEQIFIMKADGSNVVQLTNTGCPDRNPAPSPDGTRIVFQRDCDGGGIFVINMDGSNPIQLTFTHTDREPSWSPDGSKIVFSGKKPADPSLEAILQMNVDGSNPVMIFQCGATRCGAPMYSPDGTRLAVWVNRYEGEIFVQDVNNPGKVVELAHLGPGSEFAAAWSPDGTRIVFTAGPYGSDIELYSANSADGSGLTKLTSLADADAAPSWHR